VHRLAFLPNALDLGLRRHVRAALLIVTGMRRNSPENHYMRAYLIRSCRL
jgi:hypothetical protein